jgi:hypothetical protein
MESIILLHSNGILHAGIYNYLIYYYCSCLIELYLLLDIKTDNFVIKSYKNDGTLQLCLIDLGKAKDLKQKIITTKHTFSPKSKKNNLSAIITPLSLDSSVSTTSTENIEIIDKLYCTRKDLTKQEYFSGKSGILYITSKTYILYLMLLLIVDKKGAHGFSCNEMRNNEKWCYEADYFGVCSCMHQLLFFLPLITISDSIQKAANRGFLAENNPSKRESDNNCITFPAVSLKR